MVAVHGPARIGKTRLIEELLRSSDIAGHRVLAGRCHRLDEPLPFGVVVEALRGLDGLTGLALPPETAALRPLLPELRGVLPLPEWPARDASAARHLVFRAVAGVLRALGPAVLVLEDLQWADAASADLLRYILDDLPPQLVVVVTSRNDGRGGPVSLPSLMTRLRRRVTRGHIELGPLDPTSVRALAADVLHVASVPNRLLTFLMTQAGGIPATVEEFLRFAAAEGAVLPGARVPSWLQLEAIGAPPSLRDAVVADLDALGSGRRLVEAAAVLEQPASEQLLARVAGLAPRRAGAALNAALRSGGVVEAAGDAYRVPQPLAARAIRDTLPGPWRRRLHRRAAAELELEDPRPLGRIARHHRDGGRSRLWLDCAEAAADQAMSSADPHTAVRLLHEAASGPDLEISVRARLVRNLGIAALDCGGLGQPEAVHHLRSIVGEPSLPEPARADLLRLAGNLLGWTDARAGRDAFEAVLQLSRTAPARTVEVMASLGSTPAMSVAERTFWLARAAAEAAKVDDPEARSDALASRAHVLLHIGDRGGWRAAAQLPPGAGGTASGTLRLLRLGWACVLLGYYARAQAFVDAVHRGPDPPTERLALVCESLQLVLRWVGGDWEELEAAAIGLSNDAGDIVGASVPAGHVAGLLMLARGADDEAEVVLRSCIDRGARGGQHRSVALAAAGVTRILLHRQSPDAAWAQARGALDLIAAEGLWTPAAELVPTAVRAALAAGLVSEADSLVREFAIGLRRRDSPVGRASLALGRGLLAEGCGDEPRARRCLLLAMRLFGELPAPYEAARVSALAGACLLRTGDGAGGTLMLDGIGTLEALGAAADADEARQMLRGFGIRVRSGAPRGRRAYGTDLSPRERQVAELAARALTSEQIGSILHISRRTVEGHVAAIVRKTAALGKRGLIRSVS